MYNACTIRIERLQNGYNVRITDPAIVKKNNARESAAKGDSCAPWADPEVSYAFTKSSEVVEFLSKNIDKALPADEYSSSFDKAVRDVTDD